MSQEFTHCRCRKLWRYQWVPVFPNSVSRVTFAVFLSWLEKNTEPMEFSVWNVSDRIGSVASRTLGDLGTQTLTLLVLPLPPARRVLCSSDSLQTPTCKSGMTLNFWSSCLRLPIADFRHTLGQFMRGIEPTGFTPSTKTSGTPSKAKQNNVRMITLAVTSPGSKDGHCAVGRTGSKMPVLLHPGDKWFTFLHSLHFTICKVRMTRACFYVTKREPCQEGHFRGG